MGCGDVVHANADDDDITARHHEATATRWHILVTFVVLVMIMAGAGNLLGNNRMKNVTMWKGNCCAYGTGTPYYQ
jgi:hypothetical protein